MLHAARILFWSVGAACALASARDARGQGDLDGLVPAAVASKLHVTDYSVQPLSLPATPSEAVSVLVNLDGIPHALELQRVSLRADNFQVLAQDASGAYVGVEPPTPRTYRGSAIAFGKSDGSGTSATASLLDQGLVARIHLANVEYAIQPLADVLDDAPADLHVVYRVDSIEALEFGCGTHDEHHIGSTSGNGSSSNVGGAHFGPQAATTTKVAEVAFDCDYEFFVANGSSVAATVTDVETVMNAVDAIYRSEVDIAYELTLVVVRTTNTDPYTSSDSGTLLNQFRNHWTSQFSSVPRDTAHLMTGRAVDGNVIGLAYVGVICNGSYGFGLSESRFTSNAVYRASLTAHELGHNWNVSHCNGQGDCAIMCSSIGGCNGLSTFAVQDENSINGWKSGSGCLDSEPAALPGPFSDAFASTTIDANAWSWIHGALVNAAASNIPSGSYALNLDAAGAGVESDDDIRTRPIDLSSETGVLLHLRTQHHGVEAGETLIAEGWTSTGHWSTLLTIPSDGVDQTTFSAQLVQLPGTMLHDGFRLRLRVEVNETNDDWYVDDVLVSSDQSAPVIASIGLNPGSVASGTNVQVTVSASDDVGLASSTVTLKSGSTTLSSATLSQSNATTFAGTLAIPAGLAETTYDVEASVADASGNASTSSSALSVFDTPVLSAPQFAPATPQDIDAVGVSVAASDSLGVSVVTATGSIDGAEDQTIPLSYDSNTSRYVGAFAAFDTPGTLAVRFDAVDSTGHSATPLDANVTLLGSGQLPPRVTIDAAVPTEIEIGTSLDVSTTIVDLDSAIASAQARIVQGVTVLATTPLVANGSTWTAAIDTTVIDEQHATLEIVATDAQAHAKTATQPLFVFDRPSLTNASVTPSPLDAGDAFHVEVAITDASAITSATATLSLGGDVVASHALSFDAQTSRYGADFAATGHADGYSLSLSATDAFDVDAIALPLDLDVDVEALELSTASPPKGAAQGGTLLTLVGGGFLTDVNAGTLGVLANGKPCAIVGTPTNSTITARTPKLAAGPVTLQVRAKKLGVLQSVTLAGAFAVFDPPTITAVSPGFGSAQSGAVVVVSGSRFEDDVVVESTTVRIGSHLAEAVEVVDDGTLVARFVGDGASEAKVDVVVINSRGSSTLKKAFTWTSVGLRTRAIVAVPAPVTALAAAASSGTHASSIALGMPDLGARGGLATLDLVDATLTSLPDPPAPFERFGAALLALGETADPSGLALRVGAPDSDGTISGGAIAVIASTVDAAAILETAGIPDAECGAALAPLLDSDDDGTIDVWAAGCPGDATVRIFANTVAGAEATRSATDVDSRFGATLAARALGANTALLLVAAPDAAPLGLTGAGSVELVRVEVDGSTVAITSIAQFDGDSPAAATSAGFSIACLLPGDLNADGVVDAVVGFPGSGGRGRVTAYSGTNGSPLWTCVGEFDGDAFGAALAALPDVDGDGIVDLCVGAPGADEPDAIDAGAIHVIAGTSGLPRARVGHTVAQARLGAVLGAYDDRDGDLLIELVAATRCLSGADAVVVMTLDARSFARRAFAGDRLTGSLRDAAERDGLWHGVLEGESLEWTLSGSTAAAPLHAVLLDVDGTVLASSDTTSPAYDAAVFTQEDKRMVVRYTADQTRTIALVLAAPTTTTKRPYQLRSRRTSGATHVFTPSIALDGSGGAVEFEFDAAALSTLSGTVVASDGVTALLPVALETPSGIDLAPPSHKAFVTGKPAHAIKIKPKKLTLPETGTYVLRVDPSANAASSLDAALTLRLRRGKAKLKD
ncbi:MAG: IPT/TIG domain-containing protein [Planctomycetes bacterium]|nr:IPT/TIG domain-containing protein [Planctomycetota bacterium]